MTDNLNIITTWDACAEHYGETKTKQMKNLNAELETRYDLARRSSWRTGAEPIPMKVYDYLITECLPYAVEAAGGKMPGNTMQKIQLVMMLRSPAKNGLVTPSTQGR